jgi:Ethanolamine utilization protein EutJ (predicted chaperonin)
MADAVTSQTLLDGERLAIMKFTNISDGTGETAVTKVNVSALAPSASGKACTGVVVNKITSVCHGLEVRMYWDATTDVPFFLSTINTNYTNDFSQIGGITNNAGTGKNGNIVFSTSDATAGDTYTVVLEMVKSYA